MIKELLGLIPFIKQPYKIECEDATGLSFTSFVKVFDERELKNIAENKDWKIKEFEKEGRFEKIKNLLRGDFSSIRRVNSRHLVSFYKQLAAMYKNNVHITDSLQICAESSESKFFRSIVISIKEDMERGNDLASSLAKHPKTFNHVACTTIKSADTGGYLEKALYSQAESTALADEINKKLNGAMIYPTVVSLLCLTAILFFAYKVLPNFIPLYEQSGIELPLPTVMMVELSDFLKAYPWAMAVFIAIPIIIFIKKVPIFSQPFFQAFFIRFPLTKNIAVPLFMSKFMRMVSQLTEANIPFDIQAIMLREASSVPIYVETWRKVKKSLDRGLSFNEGLRAAGEAMPPFVTGNLRAGERAGQIEEIANFVADYYEVEVKDRIKNINSLLEPALIVLLGCVVGFLLFAMFLPIFDLSQTIN